MDFSRYRLELVNICTGEANNFSKYEEIDQAIESRIREYRDERFLGAESYLKFLKFCCDLGKLDVVYFMLYVVDVDSAFLVRYLEESEGLMKIKNFSSNRKILDLQEKSLLLDCEYDSDFKLIFFSSLNEFKNKESISHLDNLVLSFMLNILLDNVGCSLSYQECMDIHDYFKRAKKCSKIRRDYIYFRLLSSCLKNNINDFFALPPKFYNHITEILSRLTRCSFLNDVERKDIFENYTNFLKLNNNLKKQPLKIAVCISGVYRNHSDAIESIYENIVEPLGADVFIHTWDQTSVWAGLGGSPSAARIFGVDDKKIFPLEKKSLLGYGESWPLTLKALQQEISKATEKSFFDILRPKEVVIEESNQFVEDLGDVSGFIKVRGTLNQIKMFYGMKKSFDLALNSDRYDFIIKLRPDIKIEKKISKDIISGLNKNTYYANINNPAGLSDQAFIISAPMAYCFSQFVSEMLEQKKLSVYEKFPLYDSHNLILLWLLDNDYKMGSRKILFKTLPNSTVKIPKLKKAIEMDYKELDSKNKQKFEAFKNFLLARNT